MNLAEVLELSNNQHHFSDEDLLAFANRISQRVGHAELIQIHTICMGIADCPPVTENDSMTVRMVKQMAQRINFIDGQP
jgi:hypothetical protein